MSTTASNEIQNHCATKSSSQSTSYRISNVILPDMACPNDSHIFGETSRKSEENTLNESNHDRKSDAVLIDADFSNGPLSPNDISNKFEENISKESNPDAKPRMVVLMMHVFLV